MRASSARLAPWLAEVASATATMRLDHSYSRRAFSVAALSATLAGGPTPPLLLAGAAAVAPPPPLSQRLATPRTGRLELTKPDVDPSRPDTLHYPRWLLGTWAVQNAIVSFSMPLGSAFVDSFVQQSARSDVAKGEELAYTLRWVAATPPEGEPELVSVQDRGFNALQETRAFLGEDGSCEKAAFAMPSAYPHGELRLAFRDEEAALLNPLAPSPPLIEQLRIEWCQWERLGAGTDREAFVTSELISQRLLGARAGESDEPVLVESITRFERGRKPGAVRVRNRIAMYVQPLATPPPSRSATPPRREAILLAGDGGGGGGGGGGRTASRRDVQLAALAGDRAVAVYDYEWTMRQVVE